MNEKNGVGIDVVIALIDSISTNNATNLAAKIIEVTASRTIELSDINARLLCNNSLNITLTIPDDSASIPIGSAFVVLRRGTGSITFVAGSGVTLESADDALSMTDRYTGVIVVKVSANTWILVGTMA